MRRRGIIPAAGWTILTAVLILLQGSLLRTTLRMIPDVIELSDPAGMELTAQEYLNAIWDDETLHTGVCAETTGQVSYLLSDEKETVNLLATDSNYGQIMHLSFLSGGYFINDAGGGNYFAVISDTLAAKIYKTADIIGEPLDIGGKNYTVCGVYRSEGSLAVRLSGNGYDTVYIPLLTDIGSQTPVRRLLLPSAESGFLKETVTLAQASFHKNFDAVTVVNWQDSRRLAEQSRSLLWLLLGLIAMVLLFAALFRRIRVLWADGIRVHRSRESIPREDRRRMIWLGMLCAVLFAVAAGIYVLVAFDPYVPPALLPPGNIFDVQFYANEYIADVQALNIGAYDFTAAFAIRALTWLYLLDFAAAVMAVCAVVQWRRFFVGGVNAFQRFLPRKRNV